MSTNVDDDNNNNNHQGSTKKEYAPSQVVLHEGEKWRLCVGAAVLNAQNQLLVGERLHIRDSWQCPQGGVDDAWRNKPKESIVQAACREIYEEMGLQVNRDVVLIDTSQTIDDDDNDDTFFARYRTTGTNSWLTNSGFAGQELHWVLFRCVDARGDEHPATMCDLTGKGGEAAEFAQVAWRDLSAVVQGIWEAKRAPYLALQRLVKKVDIPQTWQAQMESLNLQGKWSRDALFNQGVVQALQARGLTRHDAEQQAEKPYIQSWQRVSEHEINWAVTTFDVDGITPRRTLEYQMGSWQEEYQENAVLFGPSSSNGGTTLKRRTTFVAEPDARPSQIAHVTVTDGPNGVEESRRYLKEGRLVLRRTFWPNEKPHTPVTSTEVFKRFE